MQHLHGHQWINQKMEHLHPNDLGPQAWLHDHSWRKALEESQRHCQARLQSWPKPLTQTPLELSYLRLQRDHWVNLWDRQELSKDGEVDQLNHWVLEGGWIRAGATEEQWRKYLKDARLTFRNAVRPSIVNQYYVAIQVRRLLRKAILEVEARPW